ncbi:uncharacterized protein LOC18427316 [Amborella trichopoda]|uniref:DUF7912 domain-containing protein n=1 Tax=Amborella trichopoda TaxID=13333 RepID=W1NVK2_AMBTC|nr:uncharacterized protein LOC18427316 [Amborella trichopoda]ERM99285.1 hypothetical protein AMTR_s00092p00163530 [Amborella trichopoda]|eukprot:XP_006836432.1 uncharacterized protein LOC18427316 [Amborella trichopoda]
MSSSSLFLVRFSRRRRRLLSSLPSFSYNLMNRNDNHIASSQLTRVRPEKQSQSTGHHSCLSASSPLTWLSEDGNGQIIRRYSSLQIQSLRLPRHDDFIEKEEGEIGFTEKDRDTDLTEERENDGWEEEEEVEPEMDDGGDGGGIVLRDLPWGERVLSLAHEVLLQFRDELKLFAFKASHRGYIYVRLDRLSNKYGCPSMEEIKTFSCLYKKRLDAVGEQGDIPMDLALEVSSPGAERLLRVPQELERFKDMPMRITYLDEESSEGKLKKQIVQFDSVDAESGHCTWKLANVKDNRIRGRTLTRKQKEVRVMTPYTTLRRVMLYLEY